MHPTMSDPQWQADRPDLQPDKMAVELARLRRALQASEDENAALRESLAWAWQQNGTYHISPDYCRHCGQQSHGDDSLIHRSDCAWIKAKKLLEAKP